MAQFTYLDALEEIDGHGQHRKMGSRAGTRLLNLAVRDDVEAEFVLTIGLVVVPNVVGTNEKRGEG